MKNFWQKLNHPIIALAPMAGITDSPFRQICKSFGADVVYTEMVSADALAYGSKKTLEFLKFDESERPVILQLFGRRPENFVKAINLINQLPSDKLLVTSDSPTSNSSNRKLIASNIGEGLLRPEGIDVNMGCPARKVLGSGHGIALMKDVKLASQIVATLKKATKLPVSVKTRLGFKDKKEILTFGPKMEEAGADALCVHARTYGQGFSGPVELDIIKKLKSKIKIPLIVSGGIYSPEDAKKTLDKTQADGIMIAQGVLGRPWLFEEIKEYLKNKEGGNIYSHPQDWEKIKRLALKHARLAYKSKGGHGIIEMRKHLAWYVKGRPDACELRRRLVRVERLEEMREILK